MSSSEGELFPRVNLDVPFAQKDDARALGARWDSQVKTWYVPQGKDSSPFAQWFSTTEDLPEASPNVKSPFFFLAKAKNKCWRCAKESDAFSIFLPDVHAQLDCDEDGRPAWFEGCGVGTLSSVLWISEAVAEVLTSHAPSYKRAFSKKAGCSYLMNHCAHCHATQGDFFMHNEPGGTFFPTTPDECSKITIRPFNVLFEAIASVGWSSICYADISREVGPDGFDARLEST